jgi:uncharacterized protein (TIGR02466 family)
MIWSVQLDADEYGPINDGIMTKINGLLAGIPEIPPGETRQTSPTFHTLAEFVPLDPYVQAVAAKALDDLEIDYEAFKITGCWANINPKGSGHVAHAHPNNFLSGIYYVKTQEGANRVTFMDPRPRRDIAPKVKRNTPANADKATLTVDNGLMLLFPAWFVHSVDVNASDDIRVSVSFNIMFSGFEETMSAPRWPGHIQL